MDPNLERHQWLGRLVSHVANLRQQSGLYAGLLERFEAIEKQLQADFHSSAAISHPGDKGGAREELLRRFLVESKYLPKRYAVSDGSCHAVSTSGHISKQIDLLFYDALNAPRLLAFGGIQYFPIESCYGFIEVKSTLGRKEIEDGLEKIAAFKRLRLRIGQELAEPNGFGILFAYTASVSWKSVCETVGECVRGYATGERPNLVVVLDVGILGFMGERSPLVSSAEIREAVNPSLGAFALGHSVLLSFYLLLIDMLGALVLPAPALRHYAMLPLTCGVHTYRFEYGPIFELGHCAEHGTFPRALSQAAIERILGYCTQGSEASLQELIAATGVPEHAAAYPGHVRVYNPDSLPLQKILTRPALVRLGGALRKLESIDYELIEIDGVRCLLPNYYVVRDNLISVCKKCPIVDLSPLSIDEWRAAHERRATEGLAGSSDRDA